MYRQKLHSVAALKTSSEIIRPLPAKKQDFFWGTFLMQQQIGAFGGT